MYNVLFKGTKFVILSQLHINEQYTLKRQLQIYLQQGFSRIYHNHEFYRIEDILESNIEISQDESFLLIDRLSVNDDSDTLSRIYDSLETAFFEGSGACRLVFIPSYISYDFSDKFEADGIRFEEPNDNMFSFNTPFGACPVCEGFGNVIGIDEKLVIPNPSLSVYEGCVQCWHGEKMAKWKDEFCYLAAKDNFPIFEPYYNLSQNHKDWLWHGLPSQKIKIQKKKSVLILSSNGKGESV